MGSALQYSIPTVGYWSAGKKSASIWACWSSGARSLVPETLPPTVPSNPSMPSATPYSVTEVPRMGMSAVPAAAACRALLPLAMIRSYPPDTKPLMMVEQVLESPWAFCSSKLTPSSPKASTRASLKPWVAASSASWGCCWQMPMV